MNHRPIQCSLGVPWDVRSPIAAPSTTAMMGSKTSPQTRCRAERERSTQMGETKRKSRTVTTASDIKGAWRSVHAQMPSAWCSPTTTQPSRSSTMTYWKATAASPAKVPLRQASGRPTATTDRTTPIPPHGVPPAGRDPLVRTGTGNGQDCDSSHANQDHQPN